MRLLCLVLVCACVRAGDERLPDTSSKNSEEASKGFHCVDAGQCFTSAGDAASTTPAVHAYCYAIEFEYKDNGGRDPQGYEERPFVYDVTEVYCFRSQQLCDHKQKQSEDGVVLRTCAISNVTGVAHLQSLRSN